MPTDCLSALGHDVQMTIFQQHITIHVVASDDETARRTTVCKFRTERSILKDILAQFIELVSDR